LTGDLQQFDSYLKDRQTFADDINKLTSTLQTDKTRQLAAELKGLEQQYALIVDEIAGYKKKNDIAEYTRLVEEKCVPMAAAMAQKAEEFESYQRGLLTASQADAERTVQEVKLILMLAVIASLIIGILLAYRITRMISRPVTQVAEAAKRIAGGDLTAEDIMIRQKDEIGEMARAFNEMKHNLRSLLIQISHNANEVSAASRDLTSGSGQAAAGSRQIAQAVQDISESAMNQVGRIKENQLALQESAASLQRVAESASITAESSESAMTKADQGRQLLARTLGQMQQAQRTIEESAAVIDELGEQSKNIGEITRFIREIVQQTNLLSLNASIEAARAGEHGRGFAVVAGEVKKLSEQTGQASEQIAQGIGRMVETVGHAMKSMKKNAQEIRLGTQNMNDTGAAFEVVYESVRTVTAQTEEVSGAAEELSAVMEQLLESERQLVALSAAISGESQSVAAVCEEQLASTEEISASSESLRGMARDLMGELQRFQIKEQDLQTGGADTKKPNAPLAASFPLPDLAS